MWAADPIPDWISADALYRDCTSLVERGRLKEAIAGLEKLLNLWPLHASAHNDLGVLYFREREFQKARHHLEMAVKLAPDDVDFRRNLADLLFETGHPEEAIRLCGEILRERPGGIEVPLERAQGLEGRPEEAGGEAPFVSVVLPVCNALGIVEKCLKSLIRSLREVRYEILVIDDASTDGTAEFLGELKSPLLKTTFNKDRLGYVEACRFGAKMASGKFLLFLSQHTEVSPEWLAGLLRQAQSFEDLGAVSSKRTSPPESSLHLGGSGSRVPSGSLLLVRRDLWEATGGFHQHYCFGHFEDAAFLSEIVKKGFRVSSHTFLDSPSDPGEVEPPKGGSHQVDPFPSEKVFPHPRDRLVSIVLLVCNQIEYTQRCLESLFLHTDIPFELIVVDNGSTDGTLEYLRQVREGRQKVGGWRLEVSEAGEVMRVTDARKKREKKVSGKRPFFCRRFKILRNEKNLGFARGNNQGMAEARGHYILLMNNDVVVTPGWLRAMAEIAEKRPEIGLVGPMTNSVSGPQLVEKIGYDPVSLSGLEGFALEFSERNRGRSRPFWRVVGFCMLIKREVIEEIGGLDERFGLGNFEDDDFCLRAKLAGFESWIAEGCFVHHFGHKTFEGAGIDYRESLLKNWEVFKKKWGIPKEVPYGVPLDLTPILHQGYSRTKHFYPLFPEDFSLSLGEALFKTGDLEGARLVFQRLLNRNPMEIDGWNNLGVIAFQEGEIEKAISLFRKALILSPEHPEVLENLGLCLLAKEDYEEAKSLFEKALALRPDSLSLLNRFGQCLIQRGDFRKAEEVYSRSYELDPSQKEVGEILSELQRLNGAEKERRASL
ncbi:MAG: glycosyltransferase [Desulfobacterota bacterium]|nr:glycosyltransferase [Thermodesulfobacteriota bacterium]